MGAPGSGKTTLAKALLKRISCVYLDNNFLADAFFRDTRTDRLYRSIRRKLYDVLYRIARENLLVGNSVLLDVPHITHVQDRNWCRFMQGMALDTRAKLVAVRCLVDEKTLRLRLEQRAEPRDAWKLRNWKEFAEREPLDVQIPFDHLDVHTDTDAGQLAELVMCYITARREKG